MKIIPKFGVFSTWNINFFKLFVVLQHLLVKVTVTNDTYSGKGHMNLGTLHLLVKIRIWSVPRLT